MDEDESGHYDRQSTFGRATILVVFTIVVSTSWTGLQDRRAVARREGSGLRGAEILRYAQDDIGDSRLDKDPNRNYNGRCIPTLQDV